MRPQVAGTMSSAVKEWVKQLPGVRATVRRLGLSSRGAWLFRREVLEWTADAGLVQQLPLPYRLFVWYASTFFAHSRARDLPGGRTAFRTASLVRRLTSAEKAGVPLWIADMEVVVDLHDPRFLQVVNELYQSVDTAFLAEFVREGDTFLDVGANHGAFALVASRLVGASGRVVAVEPQPQLAEAVERSLLATAPGPFEVHALALGDHDGMVDLLIPRSYSGTAGVFSAYSGTHPHRRVSVPLRRGDEALDWERFPGSLFVKLDVEGSEYAFLRGAQEMIRTLRPVLLMEINAEAMEAAATSGEAMKELLQNLGYAEYAELDDLSARLPLGKLDVSPQVSRNVLVFAPGRVGRTASSGEDVSAS